MGVEGVFKYEVKNRSWRKKKKNIESRNEKVETKNREKKEIIDKNKRKIEMRVERHHMYSLVMEKKDKREDKSREK